MKKITDDTIEPKNKPGEETEELVRLAKDLAAVKDALSGFQKLNKSLLSKLHPEFKESGVNLIHHLAVRQINLKNLQHRLSLLGLSPIEGAQAHILDNILRILDRITDSVTVNGGENRPRQRSSTLKAISSQGAKEMLGRHARTLFGPEPAGRKVHIMATAPLRSEFNDTWARKALKAGANFIRINCANDTRQEWHEIVSNVRRTAAELETPCRILLELSGPKIETTGSIRKKLSVGDVIRLVGGNLEKKTDVPCNLPEVFQFVNTGDKVVFDDGKFEAKVTVKSAGHIELLITVTQEPRVKLKAGKRIDFPDSRLSLSHLTEKDVGDLQFAAIHADMIAVSTVQSAEAVRKIRKEIEKITAHAPGIVLKIGSHSGVKDFPRLLLYAMRDYPVGVMLPLEEDGSTARAEQNSKVREEIFGICEAAHIPTILAAHPSVDLIDTDLAAGAACLLAESAPVMESAVRSMDRALKRLERDGHEKRVTYRNLKLAKLP